MEVRLTPEEQARLAQLASRVVGRDAETLAHEAINRLLEADARFVEAVQRGFASLDRGEYIEHEEVGERIERLLQS